MYEPTLYTHLTDEKSLQHIVEMQGKTEECPFCGRQRQVIKLTTMAGESALVTPFGRVDAADAPALLLLQGTSRSDW